MLSGFDRVVQYDFASQNRYFGSISKERNFPVSFQIPIQFTGRRVPNRNRFIGSLCRDQHQFRIGRKVNTLDPRSVFVAFEFKQSFLSLNIDQEQSVFLVASRQQFSVRRKFETIEPGQPLKLSNLPVSPNCMVGQIGFVVDLLGTLFRLVSLIPIWQIASLSRNRSREPSYPQTYYYHHC